MDWAGVKPWQDGGGGGWGFEGITVRILNHGTR
jgi:hypothetical protein